MTTPIELDAVSPGDLITSKGWIAVTEAIVDLDARLRALEEAGPGPPAAGAPVLNARTPSGNLHVGDLVTLLGQNFAPLSQTTINFGTKTITSFGAGSDDTHLSFTVPNVPPQTLSISVSNPQGTSSKHLPATVEAALPPPIGNVDVQPANNPDDPPNPVAPGTVQLQWNVTSQTLVPDTYTFDVLLTNQQPHPSDWSAVLNTTETQINAGATFTVVGTVTLDAAATSADVALTATSQSVPSRKKTSQPVSLVVGETTPVSDPRIGMTVVNPQPDFDAHGNPSNVALDGSVVLIGANVEAFVLVQIDFHDNDATPPVNYTFSSEVDDTTHWRAETPNPGSVVQTHLNGQTQVLFNITNLATDASPNDTTFTVRAAKLKSDSTEDYVSFIPVAIRNAG